MILMILDWMPRGKKLTYKSKKVKYDDQAAGSFSTIQLNSQKQKQLSWLWTRLGKDRRKVLRKVR